MPTNIQYRFQQYESAPPAESWLRLSERLNEEYLEDELNLSKRLSDFTHPAPANAWNAILADISGTATAGDGEELTAPVIPFNPGKHGMPQRARSFPLSWQRIAAAAVIVLSFSALYLYFNNDNTVRRLAVTTLPAKKESKPSVPPVTEREESVITQVPTTQMGIGVPDNIFRSRPRKSSVTLAQSSFAAAPLTADNPSAINLSADMSYATVEIADPIAASGTIAVSTVPIRDTDGNIILDEKLISDADGNYVTVTCPNGQQTRISKKFLHALSYMNAGADDEQMGIMLQEGSLWKWLFQQWRQKLLSQPSFIPSSTNFLDIMELKEILHENL